MRFEFRRSEVIQKAEAVSFVPAENEERILGFLESNGSRKIPEVVSKSIESIEFAKTFSISTVRFSTEKVLTIAFSGYGDGSQLVDMAATGMDYLNNTLATQFVPRRGVIAYVRTPAGIAGPTPQLAVETTFAVYEQVREIIVQYPDYDIRIGGYSAGTFLAHMVANRINLDTDRRVSTLYTNATGRDIYSGIATAPPVVSLKEHLEKNGYTIEECTAHLRDHVLNQEDNLHGLKQKNTVVYATYGLDDQIILPHHERGTISLLRTMEDAGIEVYTKEITTPFGHTSHASLILWLALQVVQGKDPYTGEVLSNTKVIDWLNAEESIRNEYISQVVEQIKKLTEEERVMLARYIVTPGSDMNEKSDYALDVSGGVLDNFTRHPVIALLSPERQAVGRALVCLGYLGISETRQATVFTLSQKTRNSWQQMGRIKQLGLGLKSFMQDELSGSLRNKETDH